MTSRKNCLVLGFLPFLQAKLGIEGKKEKEQTCCLLGKFNLNGYVDTKTTHLLLEDFFEFTPGSSKQMSLFRSQYQQNVKGKPFLFISFPHQSPVGGGG